MPAAVKPRPGLRRALVLLVAGWTGALLLLSFAVAPTVFDLLPRDVAGRLMGRLFAIEAPLTCLVAVIALVVHRRWQSDAADERDLPARVLTLDVALLAGVLFCTVAGYYGLQPSMERARLGAAPGGLSFGALHGISMGFFGLKLALLGWLAWRSTRD